MDCYVYYKSKQEHAAEIGRCVNLLRQNLTGTITQLPRLQKRPEITNGLITWMEVYRQVPEHFEQILQAALESIGIEAWICGERHLEYFVEVED